MYFFPEFSKASACSYVRECLWEYTLKYYGERYSNILSIWFRKRTFLNMCVERTGRQKEGERADKTNGGKL